MSEDELFYRISVKDDAAWLISIEAESLTEHRDKEFSTGWTEPTGPMQAWLMEAHIDFMPDIIGSGDHIRGLFISSHVHAVWRRLGIYRGHSLPLTICNHAAEPVYHWLRGHDGAAMDFDRSGYKVVGRSAVTGKVYVDPLIKPHSLQLMAGSWDGSDLFNTGDEPGRFFCTRRVIECVEAYRFTNFAFHPTARL